jgi:hypothetical protein
MLGAVAMEQVVWMSNPLDHFMINFQTKIVEDLSS